MSDDDRTRREGALPRPPSTVTRLDYLARGSLVGRYVVLDVLGSGGMGVVYGAFDPELDRKVAIKLLQAQSADEVATGGTSSDPRAWLVREAQALARLSHPNVVAVYDVGTLPKKGPGDGEPVFVAMELVDGVTLRESALSYQERALTLCKIVPGVAHPMYHQLVTDYVDTLIAAKRFVDARSQLEAVFALEQANQSPTLPASQTARAELALAEANPADADKYATLAIANYESAGGDKNPLLWRPLTALARARIALHKIGDAKPLLERALAIGKLAQISEIDLAPTKALGASLKP